MTPTEAIKALDRLCPPTQRYRDIEQAHIDADAVLLELVPPKVRDAYNRVVERAGDWWYA
jgi:hypothetical protein